MARRIVEHPQRQFRARSRAAGSEQFGDVADPLAQRPAGRLQHPPSQQAGVLLQHGAAAGRVDDDRRVRRDVQKHPGVPSGQLDGLGVLAGVRVKRAAAALIRRLDHAVAVRLEHPDRRSVHVGEEVVHDAAAKQGYRLARRLGRDRR
jgi:hypothetical protein